MNHIASIFSQRLLPIIVVAVLTFASARVQAQADEVLTLDIPAQNVGSALLTLAKSSNMQIVLPVGAGANVEVEGLQGEYRIEEALAALLTDTGLEYEFAAEDMIVVQQSEDAEEGARDAEDGDEAEEEEKPLEINTQKVTGTRLLTGDPSARVISFTAEDIAARGVSDLEEFFRTLPWAFSAINTHNNTFANPGGADDTEVVVGVLGVAAVNLRALSSPNTLILVNGRRVAGTPGFYENFANIINVPLSAVERVDIQLDGASAVYGSDAIGGVVNVILKSRYDGMSAAYREEYSATDADAKKLTARGGYTWGSGNLFINVARTESKPVNNLKIWTSNDFRDQFGPEFDLRSFEFPQPGIVCEFGGLFGFPFCGSSYVMQLPPGHSGVGATLADFRVVSRFNLLDGIEPVDYVPPYNGANSNTSSLTLRAAQYVGDNLRLYADALFSEHEASRTNETQMQDYLIPASNAYNPFGRAMVVSYVPLREIQSGEWPEAYAEAEHEQRNINAGLAWRFGAGHELEFNVTRSASRSTDSDFDSTYLRNYTDPTAEKFYAALASPDPAVALNLFGDGSAQGATFAELITHRFGPRFAYTDVTAYESLLRGNFWNLWGGPISYVIGGERRETVFRSKITEYTENGHESYSWNLRYHGVENPTEDLTAYFIELALPIVGERNARPGIQSLVVSLQARRDDYSSEGAHGGYHRIYGSGSELGSRTKLEYQPPAGWVEVPDTSNLWGGDVNEVTVRQSANSPRIGLQYKPIDSFTLRATWSRSFKPPFFSRRFGPVRPGTASRLWSFIDPYYPSGTAQRVYVPYELWNYNPEIQPEFAKRSAVGFDSRPEAIPGLRWTMDWSRVEIIDKLAHPANLIYAYPEVIAALPGIVIRDGEGYPTRIEFRYLNLSAKISELLETSLTLSFETRVGRFTPRLDYTRVLNEYFVIAEGTEALGRAGTVAGSNKHVLSSRLSWEWRRFSAELFFTHTPGYANDLTGYCLGAVGQCKYRWDTRPPIRSDGLNTVDLTLSYQFDMGLQLRVGGRNIFDTRVRTIWHSLPYDPVRWNPRARVLFFDLMWEM